MLPCYNRVTIIMAMSSNFTIEDIAGAMRAVVAFTGILFCPGYLVGVGTNLFGFRERSFLERVAWAVALSFGTATIFTVLLGRAWSISGVAIAFSFCTVVALFMLALNWKRVRVKWDRPTAMLAGVLLLASVVVVGELVDIQRGSRLHLSVTVMDQAYRVAFTNALAVTGVPPANPLYHPGASAPLRYYYFWYALCAICMKLAQCSARQALIASSIWSGLGLVAIVSLFALHFLDVRAGLRRFVLTATLLLTVTGLDLIPTLFNLFVKHVFEGDPEWWSGDQISSWLDSIVWVPNHMASMICCATAFLFLWRTQEEGIARRQRFTASALAGAASASALGLSIYVAAGFTMLMGLYCLRLLVRSRNLALVRRMGAAAAWGVLLSVPYLRELVGAPSGTHKGAATGPGHLLEFGVRRMIGPEPITGLPVLTGIARSHPVLLDQVARLLLLLPGYALELGFYGAVLVAAVRARKRFDEARRTALFLAICGLGIASFVRSTVIRNNDFGYRAALFPCFLLLLLGAEQVLARRDDPARRAREQSARAQLQTIGWTSLLVLGVAGTVFQAAVLRTYAPLSTAMHKLGFESLAERAFAARSAYEAAEMPANAIVQANPDSPSEYFSLANMMYSQHASATDPALDCGAVFGGDPKACPPARAAIAALFRFPAPGAAQAMETCRELGVTYLAAADSDPAWPDGQGWVWTLPPAKGDLGKETPSSGGFRIVNCGLSGAR